MGQAKNRKLFAQSLAAAIYDEVHEMKVLLRTARTSNLSDCAFHQVVQSTRARRMEGETAERGIENI